jgi:ATP-dependent Clp protease ATP-binding subunit ClpA
MFERFTERARQVVVFAQEEARTLGHNYIGTEHLLLGLLREQGGLAARVLESVGVTAERVRAEVVRLVDSDAEMRGGQIPFTPSAKKVLELALREAQGLGCNYIGTEHLLLGLLRGDEDLAARVLRDLGADPQEIRAELLRMLSGPGAGSPEAVGRDRSWLDFTPAQACDLALQLAPLARSITFEVRAHGERESTFRVSCKLTGDDDVLRDLVAFEAVGIRAVLDGDRTVRLGRVERPGSEDTPARD